MRRRWLFIAVILTVAQGCDNVTWGGMDVHMEGPPARDSVNPPAVAQAVEDPEAPLPELPEGPILLGGRRSGARATLTVVGEIQGDGVAGFPSDEEVPGYRTHFTRQLLAPGSEFILFSEGVRVGRMVADTVGVDATYCVPRPTVSGTVEMVPSAANATRLLALPTAHAAGRAYAPHRSLDHDYDQRVTSIRLASEAIPRVGAAWPPSVLETRQDMQAFQFGESDAPAIAATFLYQDRLRVESPPAGAYSIFFIGELVGGDYQATYLHYRAADTDGKAAPRFFDHLDLNGDGTSEAVLEIFGAGARGFATLARRGGTWDTAFEESCGNGTG